MDGSQGDLGLLRKCLGTHANGYAGALHSGGRMMVLETITLLIGLALSIVSVVSGLQS